MFAIRPGPAAYSDNVAAPLGAHGLEIGWRRRNISIATAGPKHQRPRRAWSKCALAAPESYQHACGFYRSARSTPRDGANPRLTVTQMKGEPLRQTGNEAGLASARGCEIFHDRR